MKFNPEPYQLVMRDHLLNNERAYANVGLGLGKTASTLSALNELFKDGAIRAALVIAPLRVARVTWPNEIQKWDTFKSNSHIRALRASSLYVFGFGPCTCTCVYALRVFVLLY